MTTAQDTFKSLLVDHLAPPLKRLGFKRRGSMFGLRGNGVWGVVGLQRDEYSRRDCVNFTGEFGRAF